MDYPLSFHPKKEHIYQIATILATCTKDSFPQSRKEFLYSLAGLNPYKTETEQSLPILFFPFIGIPDLKKNHPNLGPELQMLKEQFETGKYTAYETIGALKDITKRLKISLAPKLMGNLWMKLSLLKAFKTNPQNLLPPNTSWEEETKRQSLNPTKDCLIQSFQPPHKKKYIESKPHLNVHSINWPEILLQLPHELTPGLQKLISADPNTLDKKDILNAFAFPDKNETDIENRKLQNLITHIQAHPQGREARCKTTMQSWGENQSPSNIPANKERQTAPKKPNQRIQNLLALIPKDYKLKENQTIPSRLMDQYNSVAFLKTPEAQTALQEADEFLGTCIKKSNPTLYTLRTPYKSTPYTEKVVNLGLKFHREKNLLTIPPERLPNESDKIEALKLACQYIHLSKENKYETKVGQILCSLKTPSEYKDLFKTLPYSQSTTIQQFLERKPYTENTPSGHLLNTILNNTKPNLQKTYGPEEKTILHTYLRNFNFTNINIKFLTLLQAFQTLKLRTSPKDKAGNTPLHFSYPPETLALLKTGANPNIKNNSGLTPLQTNTHPESNKLIKNAVKLQKTLKKLQELQRQTPTGPNP